MLRTIVAQRVRQLAQVVGTIGQSVRAVGPSPFGSGEGYPDDALDMVLPRTQLPWLRNMSGSPPSMVTRRTEVVFQRSTSETRLTQRKQPARMPLKKQHCRQKWQHSPQKKEHCRHEWAQTCSSAVWRSAIEMNFLSLEIAWSQIHPSQVRTRQNKSEHATFDNTILAKPDQNLQHRVMSV
eukprot:1219501-Rhodomonas_salina.1